MKQTMKRRGAKAFALGALLASVISIGVAADTASAAEPVSETVVQIETTSKVGPTTAMRSGIRW